MPYMKVEPDIHLSHGGVDVFYVYDGGEFPRWTYWFTTDPDTADDCYSHGENGHFDARMFVGQWSETPNVSQWDGWWKPRFNSEQDAIDALIRTAIDEGKIRNPSPTMAKEGK